MTQIAVNQDLVSLLSRQIDLADAKEAIPEFRVDFNPETLLRQTLSSGHAAHRTPSRSCSRSGEEELRQEDRVPNVGASLVRQGQPFLRKVGYISKDYTGGR